MVLFAVDFRFGGTTMSDDVLKSKKGQTSPASTPAGPAIPAAVLRRSRRHTGEGPPKEIGKTI